MKQCRLFLKASIYHIRRVRFSIQSCRKKLNRGLDQLIVSRFMFGGERQAKMSRTEQAVSSTVDPYPLTEADKQLFVTGRKLEDDYILHEMLDRYGNCR